MKYYIVIGHKKGEKINDFYDSRVYESDWIEIIERDDPYSYNDYPPGAHQLFGYLDVNFNENVQYGSRASKTQEAWLIGRHRIARMLDFGNFGYQFVRQYDTKRIQFPERITISFDKQIKDNGVNKPYNNDKKVEIELSQLNEQIIHCYDKECDIDPLVFRLAKFDNYGDAYIDLTELNNYQDFQLHIDHFVNFMKNYPNSSIFLVCPSQKEQEIKTLLRGIIQREHLTNYFEFCNAAFDRKYVGWSRKKSGTPSSEYDTFSETIEEFFNEKTLNTNSHIERNFYNVPFKQATITVNNNWNVYAGSEKFKQFLQYNPSLTLEIDGVVKAQDVVEFIRAHGIKANVVIKSDPNNQEIKEAIVSNRKDELQHIISQHGYDHLGALQEEEEQENEEYRLALEKYAPQKLNLAEAQIQVTDIQVGQNQNQNQNQNQAQQMRQSNNEPYVPLKLEINNKSSIPDVNFGIKSELLKSLIGLPFQHEENAPQTEVNINYLLTTMEQIIKESPASKNCYCPLSYSVEELVPGAFYVPKDRVKTLPHPGKYPYNFDENKNTLFFSPPYASIAIKKDKYAFKPYHRPTDANLSHSSPELVSTIKKDRFLNELIEDYHTSEQKQKINLLFNNLYSKRGQSGIDLLTRSLHALKLKNPNIYDTVIKSHLLTSNDFSEYVDSSRYITTFEALGKLKDQKKIDWWNKLVEIQCRNNSNYDLNHMFAQFTGFWEDIEKLQKFIPTPDQFPFDDFADAGITLGKMYRIIGTARNRFEQIKSFDGGNISHAYMLFDLFNSSMYSKEMDDYCVLLTKELTAENAFDKSKLKETHFSPKKLAELAEHPDINLQQLKSYLLVFASVNGNTLKHNNSALAFYNALFKEIESSIQKKHFSESDKKTLNSTIMLFAAYGNNTTKERMVQDIKTFVSLPDPIKCCHDILDIYKDEGVSHFFSAEEGNRKMANSEAMLSLHTVVEITQKTPNPKQKISQATDLIVKNKSLSLAVQKIIRDTPDALLYLDVNTRYLDFKNDRREQLNQSLFLITSALNQYNQGLQSEYEFWQFSIKTQSLSLEQLNNLEQLFLDIDFAKFPAKTTLFTGKDLTNEFIALAKSTQNLDELIFVLQDFDVKLTSIKPSEQALLMRIQQLENNLSSDESKIRYVMNYQDLIMKRLRIKLEHGHSVELFNQTFIEKIDHSFPAKSIKLCYESLVEMVTTTKKEDLLQIMHRLQLFSVGKTAHNVDPAPLLSVTAFILKHAYPIENCINFLDSIKENSSSGTNEKLQYLQSLFEKISDESGCYENNNRKNKLTKETTNQIKACMKLMKQIDAVDAFLLGDLFARSQRNQAFSLPQYLQFLETLASPINIDNPLLESQFNLINQQLFELLRQYPDSFYDLLDITKFDAELLSELSFNSREELSTIAKICKNELLLNAKNNEQPAKNYKQEFAKNIKALQDKKLNLSVFYGETQLAQPSADVLVRLLDHYNNNRNKALHHYEKNPWFKRPHHKNDMFGANRVNDKELTYQTGFFDMSKQNDVLEQITRNDSGFEKSVRRNLLFTFSTYINEIGYRLPAFRHNTNWSSTQVPVRKLSNEELKAEFLSVKQNIAYLRNRGQDNIWQNKKYQRSMCKLLAIIREAMYRDGDKNAYSTQIDAVLLALMAGDYQYAMQINTGEGKALIAIAIAIAQQTLTAKQIIITTSNLGLASRDAEAYDRFIKWFGVTHETIAATTKDKSKLHAQIIHTTGNDFALCHGKDVLINNSNKIYLNDEYDYTMSHLTPSINSQTKPNEDENWWIYEEILAYVTAMDEKEAKKKPEQQAQGLIAQLSKQFNERIQEIRKDIAYKTHQIEQNADNKTSREQIAAREALDKEFGERFEFYAKRLAKLNDVKTEDQFNALIDSAIIAQFVLKKGEGYEVIEQFEEGNTLKKIVPTEGGKPITEGNVMYMYGIHQFLIQKTLMEYKEAGDNSEFIKPSELESTTYFNNYSTQAGSRSIGITGTVPKEKYKMYEALIGGGKSDVIPPHQISQRIDAVSYERLHEIKKGNEHVCTTEEQLIDRLVQQIKGNDGPALIYCNNKNVCEERRDALSKQLQSDGYVVQIIIPGVTEDFTDGDKLTTLGRQAQNQKTVTLTVGDGRGIDPVPKGRDGLLTICSFVPEHVEKLLQIYGRSGRNGKPGNTNLFILESELKKYGIKFDNLEEEFNFLDEIRTKEFDFAIKKIGFMQYEIQRQIRDEDKRTTVISFMDDLYNKLVLKAVADKVKHKQGNQIGSYTISGRWEPFVMLNDKELENIYEEFCVAAKNKLQDMQLYNIDIEGIKTLQAQYHQQVAQAINQEKTAQRGMDEKSVREKLENHTRTLKHKSQYSYDSTVELPDGIEINIGDWDIKQTYRQLEVNLGSYNKTISLMQKYVGTHIGIYGFIDESTYLPYEKIYELLEQQKQVIKEYQAQEKDAFYNYLIVTELSGAINLLLNDSSSDSKYYQTTVEKLFQNAERYDNMTETGTLLGYRTVAQIKQLALNYYKTGYLSYTDTYYFKDLQEQLSAQAGQARVAMTKREDTVLDRCQTIYQELQDKIYTEGTKPLSELTDRPMKDNNAKLAVLFSMLQMVTKEERNTAPVKRAVSEISKEVNPIVNEFNEQVKEFKGIIKQQRVCLELLKRIHLTRDTRTKMSKYSEMVHFDDVASKNMVAFYHDYNKVPETLQSLNTDIKEEQFYLDRLEAEVEILRLDAEAARERARQEAEAERKRLEDLRRRQEAEARRNLYLNNVRYKISSALDLLGNRINQIDHPLTEAIGVANKLLSDLRAAQRTYLERLEGALNELDLTITDFNKNTVINKINTDYIEVCEGLINNKETRCVLERDLGWGEFLSNLLKNIVNILITGVTFGTVNNFFSLEKSETIREIDEKKDHLQP